MIIFLVGVVIGILLEQHERSISYINQRIGEFVNKNWNYRVLFNVSMFMNIVCLIVSFVLLMLAVVGAIVIGRYDNVLELELIRTLRVSCGVLCAIAIFWCVVAIVSLYVGKGKCRIIKRNKDETL